MAFDKKSSKHSNRDAVDSAEELDAYGVWVKSEPQDLTASMAEAVNFDASAVPFEDDFDSGFAAEFDDLEASSVGFQELEEESSAAVFDDEETGSFDFDSDTTANFGQDGGFGEAGEEASTQLLMKIAGELSSIRTELSTLKKEFADIRAENAFNRQTDDQSDDFFADEDEDEKIALTGDEMEDFLSSADFSEEEEDFDAQREADEAALKELSEQNEASASAPDEEIEIDFDNLGIELSNEDEDELMMEPQEDFPPLDEAPPSLEEEPSLEGESSFEDASSLENELSLEDASSLEDVSLDESASFDDDFSFAESTSLEMTDEIEEDASGDFAEELIPLDPLVEDEEIRELRLEGAVPYTPAPDNADYLEEEPFNMDDFGSEGASDASGISDASIDESVLSSETTTEEIITETITEEIITETTTEEISSVEDAAEETGLEDMSPSDSTADFNLDEGGFDLSLDDDLNLDDDFNLDDVPAETAVSTESASTEEETGAEQAFENNDMDLSDAVIDEPDLSAGIVEAPLEEPVLGDISFEDDMSFDMDDFSAGMDIDTSDSDSADAVPVEESPAVDLSGSLPPEDSLASEDIEMDAGLTMDDGEDISIIELDDDLESFAADDLVTSADLEVKDDAFATDDNLTKDAGFEKDSSGHADSVDDSLIPEGFEINAEEAAISFDDDLEAFTEDELSEDFSLGETEASPPEPAAAKEPAAIEINEAENTNISANLKTDLKKVLSYMDHLLESLPEDKIEEFAQSEYFDAYKKIFKELGMV